MVKTIREGENRRNSRIASSAGTRSKEEQTASQICSPGSTKRDTPVDPTERPDSTFMTAFKQPALTLVALVAAEDDGRQLPDSAFASENQAACMNPTSSTDRITISSSATSACIAPARDSPLFPNEPALPQTTGEDLFPLPVGSTDPRKTDAAPSAAASSPGNSRGSDGPTGDACESTTGTRCFPTAIMYDATLGTRTLGEVRGPRTSEEDLRGRDGTTAGAPGGELGRDTASFENPRATDGPSKGGGALAEGSAFEEPRLRGRDRARLLDGTTAEYVIFQKGKAKGKTVGQRESTQGMPPVIDDAPQEDEVVDYGDGGSDSPTDDRQVTDDAALTIMSIHRMFKHLSLHETFRILGLRNVEAPPPFLTSLTACSTVEGQEPGMSEFQNRDTHRDRLPHPPPAGGSHAPHFPHHLGASSTITPQRTTTAISPQIPQATASEFTRTSTAMSENEKALCQSRLKTLFRRLSGQERP